MKTVNSKRFEEGEILFQRICWISVHHITPEEKNCELRTRNSWVILATNIQWSTWIFSAGGLGISRPLASTLWRRSTQIGGQSLECGLGMWDGDGLIIFFFGYVRIYYVNQTILYHRTLHIWWCDSTRLVVNIYAESRSHKMKEFQKNIIFVEYIQQSLSDFRLLNHKTHPITAKETTDFGFYCCSQLPGFVVDGEVTRCDERDVRMWKK